MAMAQARTPLGRLLGPRAARALVLLSALAACLATATAQPQFNPFATDMGGYGNACDVDGSESYACEAGYTCMPCPGGEQCRANGKCQPCYLGDYCPFNSTNKELWSAKHVCKAGKYCPNATFEQDCPVGHFCPPGVFALVNRTRCLNGYGTYCGLGTEKNTTGCPKGYYCPDTVTKQECPKDHYCREFTMEPKKCYAGTICPAGSRYPGINFAALIGVGVIFIFTLVLNCVFRYFHGKAAEKELSDLLHFSRVESAKKEMIRGFSGTQFTAIPIELKGFETSSGEGINVRFDNIRLSVKGGKEVVAGVSGEFAAGSLVAIMGPSGSGKTSFINALSNRAASYGEITGEIRINGRECSIEEIAIETGFVPQDDILIADLTVRENLVFSAMLRKAKNASRDRIDTVIDTTLHVLGLDMIANSIVGNASIRGISGGQKKRVNVGMELVALPQLIFMDEPTSGLSTAGTMALVKSLRSCAFMRRSVIATIHQPRYQVFQLFDDVMFFLPGGKVCYFGPTTRLNSFIDALGYQLPAFENPADYFMDVISGGVKKPNDPGFGPNDVLDFWTSRSVEELCALKYEKVLDFAKLEESLVKELDRQWKSMDADGSGQIDTSELDKLLQSLGLLIGDAELESLRIELDKDNSGHISRDEFTAYIRNLLPQDKEGFEKKLLKPHSFVSRQGFSNEASDIIIRSPVPLYMQLFIFVQRTALRKFDRALNAMVFDFFLTVAGAVAIGLVLGADYNYDDVAAQGMLSSVVLGVIMSITANRAFVQNSEFIERERDTGISILMYGIAEMLVGMVDCLWIPAAYWATHNAIVQHEIKMPDAWYVMFLVAFANTGFGYFASVVVPPFATLLTSVVVPLVLGVFLGGVNPKLSEMSTGMRNLSKLSYSRWAAEAITIYEFSADDAYHSKRQDLVYEEIGYKRSRLEECLIALFVIGLVLRIFALALLTLKNSPYHDELRNLIAEVQELFGTAAKSTDTGFEGTTFANRFQLSKAKMEEKHAENRVVPEAQP